MGEDVSGAQALAQDLRALSAASRDANASVSTTKGMILGSESGLSDAGPSLSMARGTGTEGHHGINLTHSIRHGRREFLHAQDILEGLANGSPMEVAHGLRGFAGRGTGMGLAIMLGMKAVDEVEQGHKFRKEFADDLRGIQKESAKITREHGYTPDVTSESLVMEKYNQIWHEKVDYDKQMANTFLPKGVASFLARLDTGFHQRLDQIFGTGNGINQELMKEASEKVKKEQEETQKILTQLDKDVANGNLGDAEQEEIKFMGIVGIDNFSRYRARMGTPGERFFRQTIAADQARLFGAMESPRKGPRSEED